MPSALFHVEHLCFWGCASPEPWVAGAPFVRGLLYVQSPGNGGDYGATFLAGLSGARPGGDCKGGHHSM